MHRTILLAVGTLLFAAFAPPARAADSAAILHEVTDTLLPSGVYNVVTYAAPRDIALAELGLKEAGVKGGAAFRVADEIRIFADRSRMQESPQARLWLNTRENAWWYHTGGAGSAEGLILKKGEVLVVFTRAGSAPLAWKNPLR